MLLTLDDVTYTEKPPRKEFEAITARMKRSKPRDVTEDEFLAHVAAGKAWQGGTFANGKETSMQTMQLFGLDFDNTDEKTHQPLSWDDPMFITHWDMLARCESVNVVPMAIYQTLNYTRDNPRFRAVFKLDEVLTDYTTAKAVIEGLRILFPESDQKCSNLNRIYLGTTKAVWAICESWFA